MATGRKRSVTEQAALELEMRRIEKLSVRERMELARELGRQGRALEKRARSWREKSVRSR